MHGEAGGTHIDEVLDGAPCGFLSFTDDGTIRLANATLAAMLDYPAGDLAGRTVDAVLGVGSRIFYHTHLFPLVRMQGRAEEIFLTLRSRSGEEVGCLLNVVRHERDGVMVNDCVVIRVRERQRYEEELLLARRAADQSRAEMERQRGELRDANERLEETMLELELQQQQLQEQTVELELAKEELEAINRALELRGEELDRQRRVAEEANRAKSNFLAVMSHELRTPLNAIAGYVQLVEMGIHGPVTDAQRQALDRIARSQRHLLRLINDVLNLSRLEAGHVDYEMEDVAVADLLADVGSMVEPLIASKGLGYSAVVDPALRVRADREKAKQVLINLLSNAIKFTPAGGRIVVDTAHRPELPECVFIRVSDTGNGIPADKLEPVFEPFVQVDSSHTRGQQGTGLGLAISRDLARGMGGNLRARSEEGKGSTFTLTLQRARPEPPADPGGGP